MVAKMTIFPLEMLSPEVRKHVKDSNRYRSAVHGYMN